MTGLWILAIVAAGSASLCAVGYVLHRRSIQCNTKFAPHWQERAAVAFAVVLPATVLSLWAVRSVPFGNGIEPNAYASGTVRNAGNVSLRITNGTPTQPPIRYSGERQRDFERRWRQVCEEVGPPPCPEAVPVVGYQSGNLVFRSRWRTPPDSDPANNLKVD